MSRRRTNIMKLAKPESGASAIPGRQPENAPGFRPLYAQVRGALARRIASGEWLPGRILPSEMQLAAEMGVSQGTVRKALDAMAAQSLVMRQQGRGTFVARHDEERVLFRFFRLKPDGGGKEFPESDVRTVERGRATAAEARRLVLGPGESVIRIHRLRALGGETCISEYLRLPAKLFAGFSVTDVPNTLYDAYSLHFGVTVMAASEKLKAVALAKRDALALNLKTGTPALEIDRTAADINGRIVEWRRTICRTDRFHYLSELR